MEQLFDTMEKIKNGKIKYNKEERDRICREWEICEYTRYHYDKAKLEAALKQSIEAASRCGSAPGTYRNPKTIGGYGTGKLQREEAEKNLRLELEF